MDPACGRILEATSRRTARAALRVFFAELAVGQTRTDCNTTRNARRVRRAASGATVGGRRADLALCDTSARRRTTFGVVPGRQAPARTAIGIATAHFANLLRAGPGVGRGTCRQG